MLLKCEWDYYNTAGVLCFEAGNLYQIKGFEAGCLTLVNELGYQHDLDLEELNKYFSGAL